MEFDRRAGQPGKPPPRGNPPREPEPLEPSPVEEPPPTQPILRPRRCSRDCVGPARRYESTPFTRPHAPRGYQRIALRRCRDSKAGQTASFLAQALVTSESTGPAPGICAHFTANS